MCISTGREDKRNRVAILTTKCQLNIEVLLYIRLLKEREREREKIHV